MLEFVQAESAEYMTCARELFKEYAAALGVLNDRYVTIRERQHQAAALAEVFQLEVPAFPPITVPCQRPDVRDAEGIVAQAQARETFFIVPATDRDGRRTYQELDGMEAVADISSGALIARKRG